MANLRIIIVSLLLPCLLLLAGCASDKDPYQGMSEGKIFNIAQTAQNKGDYDKAVSAYEALEAKYPYGQYAHIQQLNIIYAYYKKDDYVSAQAAAERYIHLNPQGRYVDYAYYMKAMSLFAKERSFLENYFPVDPAERNLGAEQEAFDAFNFVLRNYPRSPYANDARLHMVYIRNMFARNHLKTAEYYYSRAAYIAALDNAREIVFHYQGAPTTGKALVMMYHCYTQLKMAKQAKTTLAILKSNYADLYNKVSK